MTTTTIHENTLESDGYNAILREVKLGDTYDPWGLAMGWLFGIGEVSFSRYGYLQDGYRPSPGTEEHGKRSPERDQNYETRALFDMIDEEDVDLADLTSAFAVLDRYRSWCVLAGRDY